MARRGWFGLMLIGASAPVFALSAGLSTALGSLLNAPLLAGLAFMAFLSLWGPRFLKRVIEQQAAIEKSVSGLDEANARALAAVQREAESDFASETKPYLDGVSDEHFYNEMQAAGWSRGVVDDELSGAVCFDGPERTEPNPAGYGFSDEFSNRLDGLRVTAPGAPGMALGWGPEEFEEEKARSEELSEALRIQAMSDAAYGEVGGPFSSLSLPVYDDGPDFFDNP